LPEGPEVETVRSRLEPVLTNRRLDRVEIADVRLVRPHGPEEIAAELQGERVAAVERRGKYLIVRFESGRALLVHLRMTGDFRFEPGSHERAVLELSGGARVAYRDVRRFGTWQLFEPGEAEEHLAVRVGPEPLGPRFTTAFLAERLRGRRAPLKVAVLDQRTAGGVGNIYADEALWWSRLSPLRAAESLSPEEVAGLRRGIRQALRRGIARHGADLGDGVYGYGSMQDEFKAYGRGGEPCDRCGTHLVKTVVGGRATTYCPTCQAASSSSSPPARSRRASST
jgi:formamidopyrimidine-DNA glycosylase